MQRHDAAFSKAIKPVLEEASKTLSPQELEEFVGIVQMHGEGLAGTPPENVAHLDASAARGRPRSDPEREDEPLPLEHARGDGQDGRDVQPRSRRRSKSGTGNVASPPTSSGW